jgi:hypothetical protein
MFTEADLMLNSHNREDIIKFLKIPMKQFINAF